MAESDSIINLGELSKPATVLIEKISEAIGGLARPWQIKRVAEAEAEAERIHAVAQIEITRLQKRAMTRLIAEEARKQNNIESITAKAIPQLDSGAKPENVEDDWIADFFEKCRLISDQEMQALWARILAGEVNSPGKFSKRTVGLVASLDKVEAKWFAGLCSFSFTFGDPCPLIYDMRHPIYSNHEISLSSLSNLASIGLVNYDTFPYARTGFGSKGYVSYFDKKVWVEFPKEEGNELNIGNVILTRAGVQLAPLCGAQPVEGFIEYVKEKWAQFGLKTEPPTEGSDDRSEGL